MVHRRHHRPARSQDRKRKRVKPVKHLLYVEDREGKPGPLWCSCSECFRGDVAAAVQHLRTATTIGEQAVPEPGAVMLAVAKGNVQARGWLKLAMSRCQGMIDTLTDRTYTNLCLLRDDLNRASLALEDPAAATASSARGGKDTKVPHTTPVTTFCLRCGHSHTVAEAGQLNEKEGNR